jgi:hypothetical protein
VIERGRSHRREYGAARPEGTACSLHADRTAVRHEDAVDLEAGLHAHEDWQIRPPLRNQPSKPETIASFQARSRLDRFTPMNGHVRP